MKKLALVLAVLMLVACKHSVRFESGAEMTVMSEEESWYNDYDSLKVFNSGIQREFKDETHNLYWSIKTFIKQDLIFVNWEREIVKIYENIKPCPKNYPCERYEAGEDAVAVIRVEAGWCKRNDVKEGQRLYF